MPVRRTLDPIWVQHIWDSIRWSFQQKQMADMAHVVKYLERFDDLPLEKAELYVKHCLQDGLIVIHPKMQAKGPNIGVTIDTYKAPIKEVENPPDDGKDWYCFECHLAGDVTPCKNCFRVFHQECGTKACKRHLTIALKSGELRKAMSDTASNSSMSRSNSRQGEEEKNDVIHIEGSPQSVPKEVDKQIEEKNDDILPVEEKMEQSGSKVKFDYDDQLCSVCNSYQLEPDLNIDKGELNHLLGFVHNRIKSWIPQSISDKMAPDERLEAISESEIRWRCRQLFYQPMDMAIIGLKLRTHEYTRMCDFKADVLAVQHNVAIFHGTETQEYGASEYMVQDCNHDLSELLNCVDCYKHSNEKINSKWFCLPCRNPHKLVWAKQKGYPYWPAKILRETETSCDVRFFGGKYERSVLSKSQVKPINTSMNSLHVKKTAAFNKAIQELALHQQLLSDPKELKRVLAIKTKPKVSNTPAQETPPPPLPIKRKANPIDVYDLDESLSDTDYCVPDKYVSKKRTKVTASPAILPPRRKSSTDSKKMDCSLEIVSDSDNDNVGMIKETDVEFTPIKEVEKRCEVSQEEVSSSTEHVNNEHFPTGTNDAMPQTERQFSEAVEKTRRKLEQCRERKQMIKIALECMQAEIDRINNDRDEYMKKLFELHNQQISDTKKKQWCYNCEQDAIYHCCWNTAYCSPTCQQQHWQAEHKKVCRRKR